MTDDEQICGAVVDLVHGVWFECGLRPGHAGDHEDVHRWANEPHGPKPAPRDVPTWATSGWAKMLERQLLKTVVVDPFRLSPEWLAQAGPWLRPDYIAAPVNGVPGGPIAMMRREGGA